MLQSLLIFCCFLFSGLHQFLSLASAQPLSLEPAFNTDDAMVSRPLNPSFAGFGIEPTNLFTFTGRDDSNDFTIQLLKNLEGFSGKPPHIRLGGNTQDYMVYDQDYRDYDWQQQSTYESPDCAKIGPAFFKTLDRLPSGTPVTFGLNMAVSSQENTKEIVAVAGQAVNCSNVRIESFELGNEVDLYATTAHMRDASSWSSKTYTDLFLYICRNIYKDVLEPRGISPQFFEPPATASTQGNGFDVDTLIGYGINDEHDGNKYVKAWNQHDYFYFDGVTHSDITLERLANLDETTTQFKWWEKEIARAQAFGIPYALREMSSVGPLGRPGISNTLTAALWTLNFFLYAAQLDITSVQMHMTENSYASAWQPIDIENEWSRGFLHKMVRPQYYAHVAMAQIIGNGNGTTQIGSLDASAADSDYRPFVRAYAAYANSELQAVILINTKVSTAYVETKKAFTFNLDLGKRNGDMVLWLSYLTGPGADSTDGVSFNNMMFDNQNGKVYRSSGVDYIVDTDKDGRAKVHLRDSEAVVVNIGWKLGSRPVLTEPPDGFQPAPKRKKNGAPEKSSGTGGAAATAIAMTFLSIAGNTAGGGGSDEEAREDETHEPEGGNEHQGQRNKGHRNQDVEREAEIEEFWDNQGTHAYPKGPAFLNCVTTLVILACVLVALVCAVYAIVQFFI